MEASAETLTVKLKFANKLRRIRVAQPVDKLKIYDVLRTSNYPEYNNQLPANVDLFELTYCDEEGDRVALTDEVDFAQALAFFQQNKKIPSFAVAIKTSDSSASLGSPGPAVAAARGTTEGERPPLPSGLSLLETPASSTFPVFPGGSAFSSSSSISVPNLSGLLGQPEDLGLGNLLIGAPPVAGSTQSSRGTSGADASHGANLTAPPGFSMRFETAGAGATFGRPATSDTIAPGAFPSSSLYRNSGNAGTIAPLSHSSPGFGNAFHPSTSSSGYFSQPPQQLQPFFSEESSGSANGMASDAEPYYPTSHSTAESVLRQPHETQDHHDSFLDTREQRLNGQELQQPDPVQVQSQKPLQQPRSTVWEDEERRRREQSARRTVPQRNQKQQGHFQQNAPVAAKKAAPRPVQPAVVAKPAVSWKSIAASGNGKTSGGGKKIAVATKAPAAGQSLSKKPVSHLGDGQLSSFLAPVYPDSLFSEKDNLKAIQQHAKQGLNPAIVKHLFKGAATDDRRQERQNGAHQALGDGKNAKLILLGRDGDSTTGKFWMLKSDGGNIYLVDPRENYHVLVKSPRGGYVRVRHEQFEYRYTFEFVPHPNIKADTKCGRYFVKYRRNDNIRQYFCEIRKNHDEDDAALVFRVKRTHQTAFAV